MAAKISMTDVSMCGIKVISWKLGHMLQPFQVFREVLCREDKHERMKTMWREAVTVSYRECFTYQQRRWAEEVGLGI